MLKQLRFDLYKILKSPIMWAVFGLSLVLTIALPFRLYAHLYHAAQENPLRAPIGPAMGCMTGNEFYSYMTLCVIFFVAFFVGKDYATGYYKNIGYAINKAYYVLSKVIYIVVFVVLWFLLYFLMNIIICVGYGGTVWYQPDQFFLSMSLRVLSAIAFGLVVMALIFSTKNMIPALIIPIIFLFTWQFAESAIDEWLIQTFELKIRNGILYRHSIMNYYGFYGGADGYFTSVADTLEIYGTLLVYCALAIGVSLLFCYLRKRKN